ncbi:hypothetical protein COL8621_00464 [Actibacterium lipolyticum]|uniref:Uncharacterized protein n=1 Tax=Actibacterium lipolyticum TaxID=1524263 RepID=A0A238JLE9_9RHOB|nr:hypothetical protein COL8621_00464 [Actibacterium lipolyticum]
MARSEAAKKKKRTGAEGPQSGPAAIGDMLFPCHYGEIYAPDWKMKAEIVGLTAGMVPLGDGGHQGAL